MKRRVEPKVGAPESGGCCCGAVRYSFDRSKALSAHHCFCRDCQRATGSGFATVVLVPESALELEKGELEYYATTGKNGAQVKRGFCRNCGSQIYSYLTANPDLISVKAGLLDRSDWVKPVSSTWRLQHSPGHGRIRKCSRSRQAPRTFWRKPHHF
jgi:hypothetical protein